MVWKYSILLKCNTSKKPFPTVIAQNILLFMLPFKEKFNREILNQQNKLHRTTFICLLFSLKKPLTKKPNPQKTNKPPQDVYGKVCFKHKISSSPEIIM